MKKTFAISHCANAVVFKEDHEAEPTAIVALYDRGDRDWATAFKKPTMPPTKRHWLRQKKNFQVQMVTFL